MADASRQRQRDVAVLGGAETEIVPEDLRSIPEMVLEAVAGALDDAAVQWEDVDAIVTASVDLFDGLTASSIAVTEVVGAVLKPETRIAADGMAAAIHAVHQIAAGAYGTVLVVAHGKASMAPHWDLTEWAMDPVYLQPLGVDFLTVAGLQANLIADSNRVGRCASLGDGACAVVLSSSVPSGAAVITGTGHDLDAHYPGDRDLSTWSGLQRAAGRAYEQAGVRDPATAFAVAEPSCMFPHEEGLFVEATAIGKNTPLSPSGGLMEGTAPIVSGLTRLLAAARAIEGNPGRRALAHGAWGPAGQGHAVAIVEAT